MFEILISNHLFWLNITIPIAIGVYLLFTHQKYSIKEFLAQSALTAIVLFIAYMISYGTQDIYTKSYLNTKVDKFVYEEEWTELVHYTEQVCSGSGNSRSCVLVPRTRTDYHSDYFYIVTDIENKTITEEQYIKAKKQFGFIQTCDEHTGQVSYGDGRTFEVTPTKIIPYVGSEHDINYLYASKSNIIKSKNIKDLETRYKSELKPYPELYEDEFGNNTIYRVFNPELISYNVANKINKQLSEYASLKGKSKEVNPLVYFTTADSREMVSVIQGHYKDAHKNDAVLVISLDKNKSIKWVDSFGLTKNAEFFVQNRNIQDMNTSIDSFLNNIDKHWQRTSMEEYDYLKGDIDTPWWFEVLVALINLVGSFFLYRWFIRNNF